MKKFSLVLALAMVMVLVFAVTAMATPTTRTLPDYNGDGTIGSVDYPNAPGQNATLTGSANDNVHSDYNLNTDACAACHDTHTAVGKVLLQWADIQTTCMACHDGTLANVYNVGGGYLSGTTPTTRTMGGLFNGTNSASKHDTGVVTNAVTISTAPGGNASTATGEEGRFECSSCHEPHGNADNFRILSPDPANMNVTLAEETIAPLQGGSFSASKVTNDLLFNPNVEGLKVKLLDATQGVYKSYDTWLTAGHPASYLYGVREVSVDASGNATKVKDLVKTTDYTVDSVTGVVTLKAGVTVTAGNQLQAAYLRAIKVTGKVINKLQATEVAQYGKGMNEYCGACHRDYDTTSVDSPHANLSGNFTAQAYRHKVGKAYSGVDSHTDLTFGAETVSKKDANLNSLFTCLTCHVAHGVDEGWWGDYKVGNVAGAVKIDASGNKVIPFNWAGTVSPEYGDVKSALKRLPNMSTCETCHAKGKANFNY